MTLQHLLELQKNLPKKYLQMGIGLTLMWCRFTAQGRWASSLLIRSILRILGFNAGSRFSCKMAWISDSWTLSSSVQECRDTACEKGKKYHQKRNVLLSEHLNIDLRMQQLLSPWTNSSSLLSVIWQITALHLIKCHSDLLPLLLSSCLHPCRPIISNCRAENVTKTWIFQLEW